MALCYNREIAFRQDEVCRALARHGPSSARKLSLITGYSEENVLTVLAVLRVNGNIRLKDGQSDLELEDQIYSIICLPLSICP